MFDLQSSMAINRSNYVSSFSVRLYKTKLFKIPFEQLSWEIVFELSESKFSKPFSKRVLSSSSQQNISFKITWNCSFSKAMNPFLSSENSVDILKLTSLRQITHISLNITCKDSPPLSHSLSPQTHALLSLSHSHRHTLPFFCLFNSFQILSTFYLLLLGSLFVSKLNLNIS